MTKFADGKRKWNELDWEVVMEAQSFVAVFAAGTEDPDPEEAAPPEVPARSNRRTKKTAAGATAKGNAKGKGKTTRAVASAKASGSARTTRGRKRAKVDDEATAESATGNGDAAGGDADVQVNGGGAPASTAPGEGYWLAELLDDVTEEMLESDARVRITWLNQRPQQPTRYDYAYDDVIEVQTILCHVFMHEFDDNSLEITPKSLARVQRSLRRTQATAAGAEAMADGAEAEEDEVDDEKPPSSRRKKSQARVKRERGDDDDGGGGRRRGGGGGGRRATGGAKKLSKREEAMHIPPRYAMVDAGKYDDTEIRGTHPFQSSADDVMSANKEVIRAVVTKNHKLLKRLTEDKKVYREIHSFSAQQSVDVDRTALQYAVEMDDLTAAGMLLKARKIDSKLLAKKPEFSLPSHSTGQHTSRYSDYNRRAINASRGGREGNNALMEDKDGCISSNEDQFLWESKFTSVNMLTLFFPTGDWSDYNTSYNVAKAARFGNYKVACRLVEKLSKNGGWGFNDLHAKVLSDSGEELPAFRSVSAIKQAHQTKIRPLHLAAINPNTKYLEVLWDSVGDEWSSAKDDLGFEPIHFAAACETTASLAFLLERKCSMFVRTKHRHTPIMRALTTRREDNVIFLLEKAREESEEILSKIIAERGPGSFQPVHYAAYRGCPKALERLLKDGADVNSVCEGKMTPLCLAAREGHMECVKILLDHDAKVNVGDKLKKTPLIFAVKNGHTRIAALLVNRGANVNAFDTSENSVVHYAASYGWKSCLELLMDAGAEFWARNSWGFVPLTCALLKQRLQCSEFILERDPNHQHLDFRDRQGCTMLFLQCKHSHNVSQIKYLLDKGLNPNIPNAENEYPLQALIKRASENQENHSTASEGDSAASFYVQAIRLLLESGANPHYDIERNKPNTGDDQKILQPLQMAIEGNLRGIFMILLSEYNADPLKCASDGSDAWMSAAWHGVPGEFFLKALLDHHRKNFKGKKLEFSARDTDGDGIFHCVAWNNLDQLICPLLIRECIKLCQSPAAMLNEKNAMGYTPLMQLLQRERDPSTKDVALSEHSDVLEALKTTDFRYSEMIEIFGEHADSKDSWIRYVDENKLQKSDQESGTTEPDARGDNSDDDSGDGSNADSNDNDDDDDDDDDMSDNDDGEQKPEARAPTLEESQKPPKWVKYESILHFASRRKLSATTSNSKQMWYGRNLVATLMKCIRFDEETVNLPDYTNFKTALHYAVSCSDVEGVTALLAHQADPNHSPVKCEACVRDKLVCKRECPRDLIETSLVVSVRNSDVDITRRLLQSRANPECYEKETKNRPIHLAMMKNSADITDLLLAHKADMTKANGAGASALHLAVKMGHSVVAHKPHEGEIQYTDMKTSKVVESAVKSALTVALESEQAKHVVMYSDLRKRTPVHLAARNRDLELLRAFVQVSANKKVCVNMVDEFGRTPLHFAVNASPMAPDASFEVERFLLQSGADPNAADKFKFTPLHFALIEVNLEWQHTYDQEKDKAEATKEKEEGTYEAKKLEKFLAAIKNIPQKETDPVETVSNLASIRGVNVNAQDVLGRTPLHLAAATGAFVCASTLLSLHATAPAKNAAMSVVDSDGCTPIGRAVLHLRQTTIMTLLQNGADVNGLIAVKKDDDDHVDWDEANQKQQKKISYFHHAVKHSLTGICHMLLSAKFSKRQAVEDALLCGQFRLASNLMVGIEVSSESSLLTRANANGDTLLHSLARVKKPFKDLAKSVAWTLVDSGVKANQKNNNGYSPLHYAAANGNIHLMDFLLHNQCDLNQTSSSGETPLIYALKKSKASVDAVLDVLKYFLDKPSINLHITDNTGMNILSALIDRFIGLHSHESLLTWLETLLRKGVDANILFQSCSTKDLFNNTVIGSSLSTRIPAIVRVIYASTRSARLGAMGLLLRHGASVNIPDSNGNSLLVHLVVNNLSRELELVVGKVKTIRDPLDKQGKKFHNVFIPPQHIKQALGQTNRAGQTVLHLAVKPLPYGSFENASIIDLLVSCGADLQRKDKHKESVIDYTLSQASRFLYRYLREKYPGIVTRADRDVFDEPMETWEVPPDFVKDAAEYIKECESNGKIVKTRLKPEVNSSCDVGSQRRVFGVLDEKGNVVGGEEYNVLLTKVDVRNGRFGLNVFYRCQIVHDLIQNIYVVFTNWGRIGESGKFQNTPFHSAEDAVVEFKKIFRSKTGNHWHDRGLFVKHDGKYNLVQRVDYHTKLSDEITSPFVDVDISAMAASRRSFSASVKEMLYAITDVRNLQLAATEGCNMYQDALPLANADELKTAIDKLLDIRARIEMRAKVNEEMQQVRGDISDEAAGKLEELSNKYSEQTEEISEMSSRYYEVMPCNEDAFGASIKAFDTVNDVNTEITRLRLLIDITTTYKILLGAKRNQKTVHPLDYCYDALQVNISEMPKNTPEVEMVTKYFFNGIRKFDQSRYRISNVFKVSRNGEKPRMESMMNNKPSLKKSHSQLLWHGTKRTNLMGIISQGLRIAPPEAPHHGYMYGKGLYFANVAAKSMAYCDAPYQIQTKALDSDRTSVTKRRHVRYLLLCEVAMGTPTVVTLGSRSNDIGKRVDNCESVQALGLHQPDPKNVIVSPVTGAAMSMGEVGQLGYAFPIESIWAKTDITPQQWGYYDRNPKTDLQTQHFWDKLVDRLDEGQTYNVEDVEEKKFFYDSYVEQKEIKVELVQKSAVSDVGHQHCDATIKIICQNQNSSPFSWQCKRYRNAYLNVAIDDGFAMIQPQRAEYDELIVYDEAQARIRYLVEVESV